MLTQQTEKIRVRLESFNHELLTECIRKKLLSETDRNSDSFITFVNTL